MTAAITSTHLIDMLRRNYQPENRPMAGVLATEVQAPRSLRRADAIWAPTTMSGPPILIGHEIKISRADLKVELADPTKADDWARYCDRWWLVVSDPALLDGLIVPDHWGVLAPPSGRRRVSMTVVKQAPKLDPIKDSAGWRNVLSWNAYRARDAVGDARWKQQNAERDLANLRQEIRNGEVVAGTRSSPHYEKVAEILKIVEERKRGRSIWGVECTPDDIADAICDLLTVRESTRNLLWKLDHAAAALADPFKGVRDKVDAIRDGLRNDDQASGDAA